MSQWGAQAMAKEGSKYDEILKHYYTGVKIEMLIDRQPEKLKITNVVIYKQYFGYFNQLTMDRGQLTVKDDLPFALLR